MIENFNEEWTAEVVGRMHRFKISRAELADKCGYTAPYLSTVLNGNKEFLSSESKEKTKVHILKVLSDMEAEKMRWAKYGYDYLA